MYLIHFTMNLCAHLCYLVAVLDLLVYEELTKLVSDYDELTLLIGTTAIPKRSRRAHYKVRKAVLKVVQASKILDVRELRKEKHAVHDPDLLQQLSSYEEDSLNPFIITFLDQCKDAGVQPDSSQPDVLLSSSTPAGQVLGFVLSRKDYYLTDLHIDREHFSPWDVYIPPTAQTPPFLDTADFDHCFLNLLSSYGTLFDELEANLESLPKDRYHELRKIFQYQYHTKVPSPQWDACDRLHCTPLFDPFCTATLWTVVQLLDFHAADTISHKLRVYEKKLATFVSHFLLACHKEAVATPLGNVSLNEDGCDPPHLLARVLALKPYYVGSLYVDETLFTTLQREESIQGEGLEEVRWKQWAVFFVLY